MPRENQTMQSNRSSLGAGFVVGRGEDAHLGAGWHARETRQTDGTPCRAVEPEALFRLWFAPPPEGRGTQRDARLKILITAPVPLLDGPYRSEVFLAGDSLGEIVLESDNWAIRRFALPGGATLRGGALEFTLRSRTFFSPVDRLAGSRDCRRIACYVAAALLEPKES